MARAGGAMLEPVPTDVRIKQRSPRHGGAAGSRDSYLPTFTENN